MWLSMNNTNTKAENSAYQTPSAEMILLNSDNCIMQVSPGGNEGGGGNENYMPAIEQLELPDIFTL